MLLADENIPKFLVYALRKRGIDVFWIPETSYRQIDDFKIVELATKEKRIIFTKDKDFLLPELKERASRAGVIHIGMPITLDNCDDVIENILLVLDSAKEHIISITKEDILKIC